MVKKPVIVELASWVGPLLGAYALSWGIFVALFQYEDSIATGRYIMGMWIGAWGLLLLLMQWVKARTWLDSATAGLLLRLTPNAWAPHVVKIWPASVLLRLWLHFWFTVWWLLIAFSVTQDFRDLASVRLLGYVLVALLHFDRLLRVIQRARH